MLYYYGVSTLAPDAGISPYALFVMPSSVRVTMPFVEYLFTLEAAIWSICVGTATLVMKHMATESFKGKVLAVGVSLISLAALLWMFTFLLEKGLDSV